MKRPYCDLFIALSKLPQIESSAGGFGLRALRGSEECKKGIPAKTTIQKRKSVAKSLNDTQNGIQVYNIRT